jgi:hypothetical protein
MARMISEDIVWDDEIYEVLTHVGNFSLFIESDMDTRHELQGRFTNQHAWSME